MAWIKIEAKTSDTEYYINLDNVTNVSVHKHGMYISFCHAATQLLHLGEQFEVYWNSLYFRREDVSDAVIKMIKDQVVAE